MTNVANNTLVYKAVAKGLAMLGDQIDKDNRKLIQMLASLDKLQIKLSKGPAGFKQLAKAEKEVDAATQAYAQALHARAAAEQKRTELKKLLDTQLRQNLERDRGDQSALRKDPAIQAGQKSRENRAIANDPTQSYDVRKKALDDYVLYEEQTLQASAQSQIDMLIKQRAQEQKVDAGNQKERQRIAEELAFEIAAIETRSITEQLKIESEGGQTMLAMTEDENARREIAVETEKKIDRQRIALMKSTSNTLIAANVLTGKETLKIKETIGKEVLALVQTTGAQEVKQTEKTEEEKAKIRAKVKADLIGFFKEGAKVSDAAFNAAIERIDRESKANQEAADEQRSRVDELEMSGAISKEQADARKAAIAQKEEQREKELARQKAAMQKKKTIFEIILNTATAVVEALPNFILAGIVAAAGAAQLGIAIAQPLPEYAAGTRNHPGGLAVVGDGGRPEVVMTPSGGLFRTPASDTLVDLPARSVVFPSVEEAMKNLDLFVPSVADAIDSLDPLPKIDSRPDNRTIINIDVDRIVNTQEKNTRVLNQILFGVNRDRANRRFYTLRANLRHTKTFN
ncbi:hypothetical protein [Alistipes indistinctus]|jgi:hypothetical protein bacD2_02005|uniref:Uncharacterized protein n=3 Tax=Alistipes indistinctus TaxID=626932 RepID=G5H745_9BACT|nr:hypothetical protein [Alistipes indistinctus]EHB92684.1 hypothetical protein HMPREF9450_00888 [Alistipes indistinctus YIT 12060]UWN58458.1 hypothetical protein NQ495_06845 [Alistipes indistinctus YIT 12060]